MLKTNKPNKSIESIVSADKLLIVQDIDGVCIPLVKDPLTRKIDSSYIKAVNLMKEEFYVLTCGEHEGNRGVNRLVEKAMGCNVNPSKEGLYLPGLAACGVEYQDNYGKISHLGLKDEEIEFLTNLPKLMKDLLIKKLNNIFPSMNSKKLKELCKVAICDTRFTPTLNLNEIFTLAYKNLDLEIRLQVMMKEIMEELLEIAINSNLKDSFYLHMMPNLGKKNGKEVIKYAVKNDLGTTDIQFIINGALKEAGLLVLLNKYIYNNIGLAPFGESFNVRNAPKSTDELLKLCLQRIPPEQMPLIVGVGDTVTSNWSESDQKWLRGGSDRGFLTLIFKLGIEYNKNNKIIFINSSNEEVKRPSISYSDMNGVSDPEDILNFDAVITGGPKEYIKWFNILAKERSSRRSKEKIKIK